jgi:hypothetical protein
MSKSSFIRFTHKADILQKTFQTNDVGQRLPTWSIWHKDAACFATPAGMRATIRVTPTAEQSEWVTLFLPVALEIDYGCRVQNIRYKNISMYQSLFDVHQIDPAPSFSGKPMYYIVTLKSVIE